MGYCCVAGCKNSSADASLFGFLVKHKKVFSKWKKQVQLNRKYRKNYDSAKVCEVYFEDSCFTKNKAIARTLGYKLSLKQKAIPTIFPTARTASPKLKRRSLASYKRKLWQVSSSSNVMNIRSVSMNSQPMSVFFGLKFCIFYITFIPLIRIYNPNFKTMV